eukprot:12138828-Alexandrium_andersonii.AAC.1
MLFLHAGFLSRVSLKHDLQRCSLLARASLKRALLPASLLLRALADTGLKRALARDSLCSLLLRTLARASLK